MSLKVKSTTDGMLDIIIVPCFNKYIHARVRGYSRPISPLINRALESNAIKEALVITLDGLIVADDYDVVARLLS